MSALHVEIRGAGADLVLLHGWALHGGIWGPWLERLATRFRLHLIDLPGHGHSRWPGATTTLVDFARSVSPHVPRGAALLGWSLGGQVALELALERPSDFAALVLIATTPCFVARDDWPAGLPAEVLDGFANGLAVDYRATIAKFLALQARGDEHATATLAALRASLAARGEPDPRALAAGLDILRRTDLRATLPRVATPALVITGEHDRITPAEAGRRLAALLPAARHVQIARAGHAPFLSHPEAVLCQVTDFCAFPEAPPRAIERSPTATPPMERPNIDRPASD